MDWTLADIASWTNIYAASYNATLDDSWAAVSALYGPGATLQHVIDALDLVPGARLTVTVQPGDVPLVRLVLQVEDTGVVTVLRYDLTDDGTPTGDGTPVRGMRQVDLAGATAGAGWDVELPVDRAVVYAAVYADTPGTVIAWSQPVRVTSPVPVLSDPLTGLGVPVTIVEWTDLARTARRSVVYPARSAWPLVISDVRPAPTSTLVLLTRTMGELTVLREVLESTAVLHVRSPGRAVEDAWVAVGDVTETRYRPTSGLHGPAPRAEEDWRRLVTLGCQHVAQPAPDTATVLRGP